VQVDLLPGEQKLAGRTVSGTACASDHGLVNRAATDDAAVCTAISRRQP
jgi:hypothetical protein